MILNKNKFSTLIQLSKNDIKAKYSNSFLGIIWAFAMPLITILVFWYVFQLGFRNQPVEDVPYILWFSAAYIPWIFFVDMVTTGCNSLVEYSYLVKKIKFNIQYIPFMKVISSLFVHVFFIVFLLIMYFLYGSKISLYNFQIFYYSFATAALGLGLIWILSAVNVFFKDMTSLVNVITQIGFWVTPILWNESSMKSETVRTVLSLNPMHYIVSGYRNSLLFEKWFWEDIKGTLIFWSITVIVWITGILIFKKLSRFFADEV
ncbi:MAG: ABC transporter permease [Clostridia bacterium]|nr:ABC transporter permease [Clostridia bacterium]